MAEWGDCNACGAETWVQFLRLPEELGLDQLSEMGQNYCESCYESVKEDVVELLGEWPYAEFG